MEEPAGEERGSAAHRPRTRQAPRPAPARGEARLAPAEYGDELIGALAERVGTPPDKIRIAIRYYAEYPEEIDRWIGMVDEEAERLEQTLEWERRLLE